MGDRRSRPARQRRHHAGRDRRRGSLRRPESRAQKRDSDDVVQSGLLLRPKLSNLRAIIVVVAGYGRREDASSDFGNRLANCRTTTAKVSVHSRHGIDSPAICCPAPAATSRSRAIADLAGVSVPTVSKVINGRSDVSLDTRRRVEATIREQGYQRPDRSTNRSNLIEVLFHELESTWALEIIMGVEQVARENNLAVVLSEMQGRRTAGARLDRRRPGAPADRRHRRLLRPERDAAAQLKTRGIPFVVVDPTGEPLHDTPSIGATNWNGGLAATRHLLGLGHRRIGVICGPEEILCSRARLDGYRAAMDEAGVPIDPELIRHGAFHVKEGVAEGRALLRLPDRPTAIFAGNDLQAFGVYQAAREARLHIPEDLSVVGFDDLPVANWVGPPLTTIRQPLVQMAVTAARLVLSLVEGRAAGADAGRAGHGAGRPGEHGPATAVRARPPAPGFMPITTPRSRCPS